MLNYLPLRNVLIQGIKAMVKNKALPDSASCTPHLATLSLPLSLFLSPSQTWPYQGQSHVSSLSLANAVHPEGIPWILLGLDPGTRPSVLPHEKSVCRSRSNSQSWTWNNRLVPNQESSMSRLCIDHPAYLTYMQSTSCEMLGWMKHKLESRLLGEISITSDMQMTPLLWQKVKKN